MSAVPVVFKGLCSKCGEKVTSSHERTMDTSTNQYQHKDCNAAKAAQDNSGDGTKLELKLNVMKGRNLLALDTAIFGRGTSDPFVQIFVGDPNASDPKATDRRYVGQTRQIMKNCDPIWDQDFTVDIEMKEYMAGSHVVMRIFDWNQMSAQKAMGQVSVPLKDLDRFGTQGGLGEWFKVEANPTQPAMKRNGKNRFQGDLFLSLKLTGLPERKPDVATYMKPPPPPAQETFSSIFAQARGGQALESRELDALAKILGVAGQLSAYGVSINAPKVAVVGGQSAGKSTLFNVILREVGSMARFPSGDDTCTKVPTILQLVKSDTAYVEVQGARLPLVGHSDMAQSAMVIKAISAAQRAILVSEYPGYKDSDVTFSATSVQVKAGAPKVSTEIVIVDLPGMVASSNPKAHIVKEMVGKQIEASNTLIVAAGKTDNDEANDEGLALARTVDAHGDRTLRAYTFWGTARETTKQKIIGEISRCSPGRQPHVLHLIFDSSGELIPARDGNVPDNSQGTTMMVQRLALQLGSLVRSTAGDLKKQFEDANEKLNEQLNRLGNFSDDPTEQGKDATLRCRKFVLDPTENAIKNRVLEGTRLGQKVDDFMKECEKTSGNNIYEHMIPYWARNQKELILYQGRKACDGIIEKIIMQWNDPILRYIDELHSYLKAEGETAMNSIKEEEDKAEGQLAKGVHKRVTEMWNSAAREIVQELKTQLAEETLVEWLNVAKEREMDQVELDQYINPNPMAVLCDYIKMDANPECQDLIDGESILKCLMKGCDKIGEQHETLYGCVSCRKTLDKCECSDKKWETCVHGEECKPCACGKVVLDDKVAQVLRERRRILMGAKEWVGYNHKGKYVGSLGLMRETVYGKSLNQMTRRLGKKWSDDINRQIPPMLITGDRHEEERKRLKAQQVLIQKGIFLVEELQGVV